MQGELKKTPNQSTRLSQNKPKSLLALCSHLTNGFNTCISFARTAKFSTRECFLAIGDKGHWDYSKFLWYNDKGQEIPKANATLEWLSNNRSCSHQITNKHGPGPLKKLQRRNNARKAQQMTEFCNQVTSTYLSNMAQRIKPLNRSLVQIYALRGFSLSFFEIIT